MYIVQRALIAVAALAAAIPFALPHFGGDLVGDVDSGAGRPEARGDVDDDIVGCGQCALADSQAVGGRDRCAQGAVCVGNRANGIHLRHAVRGKSELSIRAGLPALRGCGEERTRSLRGGE
jgi:hypothetical protein